MATIRDPAFWRRFSLAVHLDAESKNPSDDKEANPNNLFSDHWIQKQRKKRQRSILFGFLIFLFVAVFVAGVVVVIWWLKEHNWLQDRVS